MSKKDNKKQQSIGRRIVKKVKFLGTVAFFTGLVYVAVLKRGMNHV